MNAPNRDIAAEPTVLSDTGITPETWFSVPIWGRLVTNHQALNVNLLSAVAELEAETPSVIRSNVGGWHSASTLHRDERFAAIRQIISRTVMGCARNLAFDFEHSDLIFQEMWANKNGGGDYNRAHVHPTAIFSGSYYVKVPPESGNLEFYDPVRERVMSRFPLSQRTRKNSQPLEYPCRDGLLVIFPSWLQHSVQANRSSEHRVSLAFNLGQRPKPR